MRTITIIIIILFLSAVIVLAVAAGKNLTQNNSAQNPESQASESIISGNETVEETTSAASLDTQTSETDIKTEESGDIAAKTKIDIYLDGDKDNGIYLGEAKTGLYSAEAEGVYGKDFSNSGFSLMWDRGNYIFEPGSIHYIYLYLNNPDNPGSSPAFIRKEIQIPGKPNTADNIRMYLESPPDSIIDGNSITIAGWAADLSSQNNTGINNIEIYLDGPRNFGKFLGNAQYGLERQDVADVLGNPSFSKSGFTFTYDISKFESGATHSLYIYALSNSNHYQLIKKDIKKSGSVKDSKESGANIFIGTGLEKNYNEQQIEINGWVVDLTYAVKKIVFTSDLKGNEDIYSMNLDGSDLKQLTDNPGDDMYPGVSKDGKKIVYTADINGTWQIMIMNWDGTDKKQITFGIDRNGDPSWSFDGKYIYFEKYIDGNWALFKMDSDGNNQERLTFNLNINDWHPFGHRSEYKILYESGISGSFDIYIMDDNGQNIKKLSNAPFEKRVPSISIDSKYIVFQGQEGDNNYSIYIMDSNGENMKKLTSGSGIEGHANISPDNQYITFEEELNGKKQVFIMNLDGSNQTLLTKNQDHYANMPDFIYLTSK